MEKVMAVGAHADDLEFACSGTMAKFVKEGKEVFYVIISAGEKGNQKEIPEDEIVEIRKKEQRKAAEVIGVKEVMFLDVEDGKIENDEELRRKLVKIIRDKKPGAVFTFDPDPKLENFYVYHSDHRETGKAVFDAVSPRAGNKYYYKDMGIEPHRVKDLYFFGSHEPNEYIDITDFIELKIKALKCHESQMVNPDNVEKFIKGYSEKAGSKINVKYAESFRKIGRMEINVE